jgi:hypothetical protein
MKKTFASSLAVLGIVTVLGAGCMDTTGTPTTSSSTMTPDIASLGNTVTETNSKLNFSITFPKDIFQLTSFGTDNHPGLTSQYYITDDSSGTETKHAYTIEFNEVLKIFEDIIKQDNAYVYDQVLALKKGIKADPSFLVASKVAGKQGYTVTQGAEGINVKTYYLSREAHKTFVIRLNYIGDSRSATMKPSALSEAKQMEYFDQILNSFTFTK